jgi:hypothetical protein
VLIRHSKRIVDLAIKNRLPSMYEGSYYVEAGGLMSYSANSADRYRRAACTQPTRCHSSVTTGVIRPGCNMYPDAYH